MNYKELLEWFAEFAAEHYEWTNREFPKGTSEGDWLDDVFEICGYAQREPQS